jgi:hypothetical protein
MNQFPPFPRRLAAGIATLVLAGALCTAVSGAAQDELIIEMRLGRMVIGTWLPTPTCRVFAPALITFPAPPQAVWSGGCRNDLADGDGMLAVTAAGQWERYQGRMQGGMPHGEGTLQAADGSRFDGHFADGLPAGQGRLTLPNGSSYDGMWAAGAPNGHGTFLWPAGTPPGGLRYEGQFVAGRPDGHGVLVAGNGRRFEGEFRHGQINVAGGENPRISGASSLLDCAKVGLRQATCWRGWPAVGFDHQGWRLASPL